MQVQLTCANCGAAFSVKRSHAKERKCCSKGCMGELYSKRNIGAANPNWRGDKLEKKCEQCGAVFRTFFKTRRFCGRGCFEVSDANRCPERICGVKAASRVDGNQEEIVSALRGSGVSVEILSDLRGGVPDLIASNGPLTALLEVKNPYTPYGRKGLTKQQAAFARSWPGQIYIVRTVSEALAVFGIGDGQRPSDVSAFGASGACQ